MVPHGRLQYQSSGCALLLVRLRTIDSSSSSPTFQPVFYPPCHHSSSCLSQLDCKDAVEDHVASLAKVKVNNIHSSPLICRASCFNTGGKQVGQVLFALAHPVCLLLVTFFSLRCLDTAPRRLCSLVFVRRWPACSSPDPPSFEDRYNICRFSSHQEHPDASSCHSLSKMRESSFTVTSSGSLAIIVPCSRCWVTCKWLPGVVSNLVLLFWGSTSHPRPYYLSERPERPGSKPCQWRLRQRKHQVPPSLLCPLSLAPGPIQQWANVLLSLPLASNVPIDNLIALVFLINFCSSW